VRAESECLGPTLSYSGVDTRRGTSGFTPRPAQFPPSSKDPDFPSPTEFEENGWGLALGRTLEEEATFTEPETKSGGDEGNSFPGIS